MNKMTVIGAFLIILIILLMLNSCSTNSGNTQIEASGIIEAVEIRVAVKSPGQILKLNFAEGSAVTEGDTLAIIDHISLNYQLQAAEAAVDAARAQYNLMKSGARQEDLISAEEAVKTADANYQAAKADFDRINSLFSSGSSSEKALQDASTRLTVTESQAKTAAENLKKLRALFRPEELQSSRAMLRQAEANRDLLRQKITDCYVIAPLSGTVVSRPFEPGETAAAGMTIAKIARTAEVEMIIYVPENQIGKIQIGQSAKVKIDSHPDRFFTGSVIYISPEAEFTPKNIQTKEDRVKLVFGVKITIENRDLILKSGMPADAEISI